VVVFFSFKNYSAFKIVRFAFLNVHRLLKLLPVRWVATRQFGVMQFPRPPWSWSWGASRSET